MAEMGAGAATIALAGAAVGKVEEVPSSACSSTVRRRSRVISGNVRLAAYQ